MTESPTRADKERRERRKKRGATVLPGIKLGVNKEWLDEENFKHRWINDDGGRIRELTEQDDYELVRDPTKQGKDDADGLGSIISKVVGKDGSGRPMMAYLARKPKEFYEEDQKEKFAAEEAKMESIKRGVVQSTDGDFAKHGYIPGGETGIKIEDRRS